MSVRTIVVTGAFGQLGRRVTAILLDRCFRVVALDLSTEKTRAAAQELALQAPAGRLVPAFTDLLDVKAVRRVLAEYQPEAIVHLAAVISPSSYRDPRLARRINVDGTQVVLDAAQRLPVAPLVVFASSAAVYGSRNPYRHPELITAQTPVNPIDQYGHDKVCAEAAVSDSALPHCILRLAGIISPDAASSFNRDYLVLMRATPGNNRLHTVDARDAALALANVLDCRDVVAGQVLLIGGDASHRQTHRAAEDDMMHALGLGRLGDSASLPGDPLDEQGWSFTGWFDTTESQALLDFQHHRWADTIAWVAQSENRLRPVLTAIGPLLRPLMRPLMRQVLAVQRRREHRGPYADPWRLIEATFGPEALADNAREHLRLL